ncbi:mycofactocin system transcriptional regulator [Actinocorallia sp. A-T 12471]|uniref:mycofactocin system transcriptional regulator n=1 Tax=Actinocorallia sp. A-T 12471 TaxID=3089813 RepID=UPI0029CF1A73|nr:mycofactocin system transcriptional regulator [Actinocorallia sp. A-T 12471]MDX6742676.1 mycofactocin system transcriptional regulator [Actinocorallia sp. A-T 12471]
MQTDSANRRSRTALGRPRVTSRAALERLAFELFARRGFDETTVDDIAAAAGIGRRTFFRYFASKNDLVWGDFEGHLDRLRVLLDEADADAPMMEAVRAAVVEFNRYDPQEVPWHRQRMELILRVPTLQADATLRYAAWREIITAFVAARTGQPPTAMLPVLSGYVVLAASISGYEYWLSVDAAEDLTGILDVALRRIGDGLSAADPAAR